MNLDGKKKRRGMVVGKTAKTKKAIVQLTAESADIEIFQDCKAFAPLLGGARSQESYRRLHPPDTNKLSRNERREL